MPDAQTNSLQVDVDRSVVPLVTLMGVLGAVMGTVPLAQGRLPRVSDAGTALAAGIGTAVLLLALHELAHVVGLRLGGQRGVLTVFFSGYGCGVTPFRVDGRRLALAALCGPSVDFALLTAAVVWYAQAHGLRQQGAALSAAITVGVTIFLTLTSHNDFAIASKALREGSERAVGDKRRNRTGS